MFKFGHPYFFTLIFLPSPVQMILQNEHHSFFIPLSFIRKPMTFPQYRKLDGFKRYYEILDERTFVEVAVMNDTITRQTVEKKIPRNAPHQRHAGAGMEFQADGRRRN